jgi:hypothetical protein
MDINELAEKWSVTPKKNKGYVLQEGAIKPGRKW